MTTTNPKVTITVEGYQEPLILILYHDKAPVTVDNFIGLANSKYYEGSIFHRVIADFMIQGGMGASGVQPIEGEFAENGFPENNILHERGVISMARTQNPNSATTQFFIVHKNSPHLDGKYAAFGKMLDGWAILDAIATTSTDRFDRPIKDVVISEITVETFA